MLLSINHTWQGLGFLNPRSKLFSLFYHDHMFAFIQFILIKYNKSQSYISIF